MGRKAQPIGIGPGVESDRAFFNYVRGALRDPETTIEEMRKLIHICKERGYTATRLAVLERAKQMETAHA
jgi:hypothetical protein